MGFNHGNRRAFGRTVSTSRVWILGRSHQSRKLVLFHLLVLMKTIGEKNDALEKKRISNAASVLDPQKKCLVFCLYTLCVYINQQAGEFQLFFLKFQNEWCFCFMKFLEHSRAYTKAFGYTIAAIFYKLHEGIWGLRQPQDCLIQPLSFLILTPSFGIVHFHFWSRLKPAGATRTRAIQERFWHHDPSQNFDGRPLRSMARCWYGISTAIS